MFKNWLKIAFINYKKNWLSTIINVFGLSLGLCIFLLVFINWQDEKSYEQWVPNKENIYLVENSGKVFGTMSVSSFPELSVTTQKYDEIEDYTLLNNWGKMKISSEGKSVYVSSGMSVSSIFSFLAIEKIAGDLSHALDNENQIALSEQTAKQLFGDEYLKSLGKSIKKDDDGKVFTVSAIYKMPAEKTVFKPEFMIRMPGLKEANQWTNYSYTGFFRLKPGTDPKIVEDKITKDMLREDAITAKKWGYEADNSLKVILTRIDKMRLDAAGFGIEKGDKKSILIMLGLSVLILVLSAINLVNLKTAQAAQRAKEVGVRKALGTSKGKLVFQFWLETFVICLVAYFVAFCMIELLLPKFNTFLNKEIKLDDFRIFLLSGLFLFVFSLFAGVLPALYLSNFKPINTLKGNFARSKSGVWLRNSILTIQLIISSFFIICSVIIHSQVKHMMNKELGFKGDQVLSVQFKKQNRQEKDFNLKKYLRTKDELKRIAGVVDVTGSMSEIGIGMRNTSITKYAADTTKMLENVMVGGIDENYFNFYKIKMASGRDLDWKKASDTINGAVVNEIFAKKMGWNDQQALGKELKTGWEENKNYKIIGVVKDFYINGVSQPVTPAVFFNYNRNWAKNQMDGVQIKLSKNDIDGTITRIRDFWMKEVDEGYPFDYSFVDKNFQKTFQKFENQKILFSVLNIVVLAVALLGLFSLSSLLIEQKLKDVAIKKTLGADEKTIVWDLTKKFLIITVVAVILSFPLGYYAMNEWLKDFAYRIDMPWFPYVLSLILLLLLTFAVVSIKAIKATKLNLVKFLKYE
ncbi:putative ABC transport system permease protein [Soonwooa buanensis]|uniref:Putative ABC transport system permease protein n=1 Tax=Soonwooa buanensis TaxID=619805 RepID=A0A1T5GC98_9FLAO|nr:ABC transporter permease [Soonwooa buanensis]SKC06016.1 putative ABC transport system permease protein [Soonwooa buanensis]